MNIDENDFDRCLEKLHEVQLDILDVIASICEKNGIGWFLQSGSALGARRHQGFIPWDDDIDIGMLRTDYNRFIEAARSELPAGYSLDLFGDTEGYAALFAKVCKDGTKFINQEIVESGYAQGIFVDIFPYDALASDKKVAAKQIRNAKKWKYISYLFFFSTQNVPHKRILGKIEKTLCRLAHPIVRLFYTPEHIKENFEKSFLQKSQEAGEMVACLSDHSIKPFHQSYFHNLPYLNFEGRTYPVPKDVEKYLEDIYGDWTVIPSEQDRHTHLPLKIDFGDGAAWEASKR